MFYGLTPHKVPAILRALHPCYASLKIGNYNALKFKQHGKWTELFWQIAYWETVYCFALLCSGMVCVQYGKWKSGALFLNKRVDYYCRSNLKFGPVLTSDKSTILFGPPRLLHIGSGSRFRATDGFRTIDVIDTSPRIQGNAVIVGDFAKDKHYSTWLRNNWDLLTRRVQS